MDKIDICNMALTNLASIEPITSLADTTTESRVCDRFYDLARKLVLQEFPWSFAKKLSFSLTATTKTQDKYEFEYECPSDLLRVLPIDDTETYEKINTVDGDGNEVVRIVCDTAEAKISYIANIVNADMFSAPFIEALSWKLASMIAIPLSKDAKIAQNAYQMYGMTLANAKHKEALQLKKPIEQGNRYMNARR